MDGGVRREGDKWRATVRTEFKATGRRDDFQGKRLFDTESEAKAEAMRLLEGVIRDLGYEPEAKA